MTVKSPGDYSNYNSIDFALLQAQIWTKDPNFNQSKQKINVAITTALVGTIITVALAIFTSPVFPIIAGLLTAFLTISSLTSAKASKSSAQSTETLLNCYMITKQMRISAGDTYDDSQLTELYRVNNLTGNTVFYNLNAKSNGETELRSVHQDHGSQAWVFGA